MDIYDKIDKLLNDRKISRRQLAEKANINPSTLQSAFSRRSQNLSWENILKITVALEIPITELIDEVDLWGTRSEIAKKQEESVLTQIDKLSDDEKIYLLARLDVALEYITRTASKSRHELLENLADVISCYSSMLLNSWEMRFDSKERYYDYLLFLKNYDRCINLVKAYKDRLINDTFNSLEDDTKLRELIYGEDESHE